MSLDVAIQTFRANKDTILWKWVNKKDGWSVEYYYAEDGIYVLKLGTVFAFVKARSPMNAWKKYCREREKAFEKGE